MGYPTTTQDSLPVAGQALLDGVLTRKVPMKGFKVVIYISFPFPKLCLAQSMQPRSREEVNHRQTNGVEPTIGHVSLPAPSSNDQNVNKASG
jgi:hypothetical protein